MNTAETTILRRVPDELMDSGYSVCRLISSRSYIREDLPIQELVNLFNGPGSEINAVGVVSDDRRTYRGIIVRKELMKLVSRPFGLDVLKKRPVSKVTVMPREFELKTPLLTVSEELKHEMKLQKESYYTVLDKKGGFAGIFSTRNLLIHLSEQSRKDLQLARKVQNRMVKSRHNIMAFGVEVATSFTPAQGVGGDFYLTKKINTSDWILMLCDVSGKGVAASIVTAMLYGIAQTYDFRKGLKAFVRDLNRIIFETFKGDRFLTGVFMQFNELTGKVIILDMGHSYLSLIREGKSNRIASEMDNLPVGVTESLEPKAGALTLKYNDIIMTITDGLVEQKDASGQCYEMRQLQDLIKIYRDCSLEEIRDAVLLDFETFRQDTPYHDDMTFLLIRYPHPDEAEDIRL